MKTINYTGDSKLIARIVDLLNHKAPMPLDGQGNNDWGTNGQVLTTDGNGNTSWTTPQGGGGGDVTDVEVNGTSVVNAQGVAEVSVPTKTSDLNNDSGFITNLVNDLANYYTKSQTYTQAEVNALISGIVTLNILVVQALPTQDISTTTIYLVPKQDTGTSDIYDEYLYINNAWELIGTTQIDLSNYVTTTDLSTALADYVTSVGLATILADYVQSSDLGNGTITIQKNGTTVDTFTTNQSANKTVNITVTEGHTIWDRIKTALTARGKLWFADASVSDASADGATKVEVITEVDENGWASATEDGLYHVDDNGSTFVPITGNEIAYDANTSVNEKIDDLDRIEKYTITVPAIGSTDSITLPLTPSYAKYVIFGASLDLSNTAWMASFDLSALLNIFGVYFALTSTGLFVEHLSSGTYPGQSTNKTVDVYLYRIS